MYSQADLTRIHKMSFCNKSFCEDSSYVGCFHCGEIYPAYEIEEYINEENSDEGTAICPHCWVDAVLPNSIIDLNSELMLAMYNRWFVKRESDLEE